MPLKIVAPPSINGIDLLPKRIPGGLNVHYFSRAGTGSGDGTRQSPLWREIQGTFDWTNKVVNGISTHWNMTAFGWLTFPGTDTSWTLYNTADDGQRVYIKGDLAVSNYIDQAPNTVTWNVTIPADKRTHPVTLLYYNGAGSGQFKWEWYSANTPRQVIPATALSYDWPIWWPVGLPDNGMPTSGAAFYSSWRAYADQFQPMFRVTPLGMVEFTGLICNGTVGNVTAFMMPEGLWSPHVESIHGVKTDLGAAYGVGELRVKNRYVSVNGGSAGYVSLEGVRYQVDMTDPQARAYLAQS